MRDWLACDLLTLASLLQELCAGTQIGQEFYKLVLVDIVVNVSTVITSYFFWYWKTGDLIEADIAQSVISLCYRQSLILFGMAFCPFLSFLGTIGTIATFYMYYMLMFKTCRAPKKSLDSNTTGAVFIRYLSLMLLCSIFPLLVILRMYQ